MSTGWTAAGGWAGFWTPSYETNVANLYDLSGRVSHSLRSFEEYVVAHHQDINLEKQLGLGGHS